MGYRVISAFIFIAATIVANADPVKLENFSIKDVETRCQRVHGAFTAHDDGSYGCEYSKGTVTCTTDQHCTGILKKPEHKVSKPKPHHRHPYYPGYRHWYPYQW